MEPRRIPTEDPQEEQLKLLRRFAYQSNIQAHLDSRGLVVTDPSTVEFIAGCVRQGEAYFSAASTSPLDIAPLLLYYGATNLLAGVSVMITGVRPTITDHGMGLEGACPRVGDTRVVPRWSKGSGLRQLCEVFSNKVSLPNRASWSVEEILGSVPDLRHDFEICYPSATPFTIPVEVVRRKGVLFDRILRDDLRRFDRPQDALTQVTGLSDAYLEPQVLNDYIVLNRKLGANEIGTYSILGQKHLQIAHSKNNRQVSPDLIIVMLMGLFALGYLSRYYPEIWNPFTREDKTGERLVVEKFLAICGRYLPNLVLNFIEGVRVQFVIETASLRDLAEPLSEKDIRKIIQEEVRLVTLNKRGMP